jgi:hypothetical protein
MMPANETSRADGNACDLIQFHATTINLEHAEPAEQRDLCAFCDFSVDRREEASTLVARSPLGTAWGKNVRV